MLVEEAGQVDGCWSKLGGVEILTNTQSKRYDAFLSYNSQDRPTVKELAERLRGEGLILYLDKVVAALGRDRLWSFSTKAKRVYTTVSYQPGDALLFSPESRGLPARWIADRPDRALRIPIRPEARSLNLANAVAIAVFEAVRQISVVSGQ